MNKHITAQTSELTNNIKKTTLIARDGYRISATLFKANHQEKGRLVVAGATGVPQTFYQRFAEYTSSRGFTTLTLDYRGIGDSRPETLKGFRVSFVDWARLDLAAAVDLMKTESLPLYMVGHSYGGLALGLLPNHYLIEKCYMFALTAGWKGWMPRFESIRVQLLWHFILPIIVKLNGYLAWSKLGMGEDLPLDVYKQWKYWCRFPHYFFDDPEMKDISKLYNKVRVPIMAVNSADDRWATPQSRDAFIKGYCNAPVETRVINLNGEFGNIGHMGYFKSFAAPLWDEIIEWFNNGTGSR